MKITSTVKKNNLYIGFSGELDQSVVDSARKEIEISLKKDGYSKVVFDMSKLSFMDSTGIGLLLSKYKTLSRTEIPVYISSPNKQIDKIIRISGLYSIMPLI